MSDILCDCPQSVVIPKNDPNDCGEKYGLYGKMSLGNVGQPFANDTVYDTESEWTNRILALDITGITMSPKISAPEFPGSEALTFGGDTDETFDGAPVLTGETTVLFTSQLYDLPSALYDQFEEFKCRIGTLGAILIGNNFSRSQTNGTTVHDFIPITFFFLGTVMAGGRLEPNKNALTIGFGPGWQKGTSHFKHVNFNPYLLDNA